jgi:hypothetical protein
VSTGTPPFCVSPPAAKLPQNFPNGPSKKSNGAPENFNAPP